MKPIDQTKFGKPHGNCMRACIASLFEISLEQAPELSTATTTPEWSNRLNAWCAERGLHALDVELYTELPADMYVIGAGPSPRGIQHAVILRGGKMVHDPHPSRGGVTRVQRVTLFVVRDLARYKEALGYA